MRRGLSAGMILLVVLALVAGAVAGTYYVGHRGHSEAGHEAPGPGETSSPPTSTATSSPSGGSLLAGHWSGTYTGARGSGEWEWVIVESGRGYTGCLRTTGTYSSGESWLPVSISVDGNRITVGTVGPNAVTFTGTVSGGSASGSWSFSNGADGGSWQGSRLGPADRLPCQPMP